MAPRRAQARARVAWAGLAGLLLVWSAERSRVDAAALFDAEGWSRAREIASGLATPDLSGEFVARIFQLTLESLAIASLGMLLALVLAVPLALLAARLPELPDEPGRRRLHASLTSLLRGSARTLLTVNRAIPEIIWAFLFVRVLGLGPGPAVLAIGVSFSGVIGRLYAELLEAVDPEPVRALRRAGAGPLAVLLFGVLPQARSQWIGYGLFRFECAVRSAAVLGIVGAGGLGAEIQLAVRYFQFDKLATALIALLSVLVCLELASALLRKRTGLESLTILAAGALYGLSTLDVPWGDLLDGASRDQAALYVRGFAHPSTNADFWLRAIGLIGQTLGIALCGTFLATAAAGVLAPLAAHPIAVRGFLDDPPGRAWPARGAALAVFVAARFVLQILRALPDLVWALLFVAWVGPGPFAGALAIAAHTTGLLGRLFGEVYEEVEPGLARSLEAGGAGRLGVWLYGVLPIVRGRLAAYALFRLEVNLRATAMIGFVGAGGLGDAIHTAISLFHARELAALLMALFAMVVAVDAVSGKLRRGLLRRS